VALLLHVLIIQDSEAEDGQLIHELQQGNYNPVIERVTTPEDILDAIDRHPWDLVIANSDLPHHNALTALSLLKERGLDLPFIVVSSSIDEASLMKVTRAGAHDYILRKHLARLLPAVERELWKAKIRLDQKQQEASLRESEANLLALIENAQGAVWSIDTEYRAITLNSVFKQQFFQAYGTQLETGMHVVDCLPPDLQPTWMGYYDRALQGERFLVEEHFAIPTAPIDVEVSFNPICTDDDCITGVAIFSRDITERKRDRIAMRQAKDQLQAVLDAVPGAVSWFSSDLKYLGINRHLAAITSQAPEDFVGKDIGFMDGSSGFSDLVRGFFASPVKESTVEVSTQVDGSPRSYLIAAQKYYQDQAAVFIGIDISDRKKVEEALRDSQERYALAVRGANDGLWDWNLKTEEVYYSPRWKSMLGYQENEIGNKPDEWFSRIHAEDLERVKAQVFLHFGGRTQHFESEHRVIHKDGGYRWMLSRGIAVRDTDGKASRMAGSQTDITKRKQAEEQLLHDACHDMLTGLPNRALLIDRLGLSIDRAKRLENHRFAVLFLDLDRFKVVNDSLGHTAGDELLVTLARRLETFLRAGDTFARLGGDEFVMLLEDIKDINDAVRVAERTHKALELPFNLSGQEVFTSTSIGIALSDTGYDRPEDTLRDADTAMYRAKSQGRARHEVFDRIMYEQAVALLQVETDLRRAIDRQELRVYYQPIVSLATCKISGFEALVRWQHPERGLISPSDFIPVAEETGLIIPLGAWVLREACRQTRIWQKQLPSHHPLTISVNLSGKQFSQSDLVYQIGQILQETELQPNHLKLEITESVVMGNAELAIAMLFQLKALGVQLQIDDFGTGYSSLSYLHRFPTDTLKIDRSFVSRMSPNGEGSEIVRTIVTLAHNMGMSVTAEGVETIEQLNQLRTLKSDHGQGYFFSKPVNCDEAESLLAQEYQLHPVRSGTFG